MEKGFYHVPQAINEPIKAYAPGSAERAEVQAAYDKMWNETLNIPMVINGKRIETGKTMRVLPPHDHQHNVGSFHFGEAKHVHEAIQASLDAKEAWENMSWANRSAIFLKAADLVAGPYRARINAATMIQQSKTIFQAEIDSACELADFLRFNVQYATEIYAEQPYTHSHSGLWNRVDYRPLEGFTFAITPFNFTAIAGNLPTSMAMMGNTVVWKPSLSQLYSAHLLMEIFEEAGIPPGVINMIITDPKETADIVFAHPDFAGLHYTGSTTVFQNIWKTIGNNITKYRTYPRIVGETGGKDFVMVHRTAKVQQVVTALIRGAFEFQGQKCSAASRAYIPSNLWDTVKSGLVNTMAELKMGSPRDFENFVTAVIHEGSFDKLAKYIDQAKADSNAEIIAGGNYDKSKGYFVEPTVIVANDPKYVTMEEELFGPVLTIYVYPEDQYEETLKLVDETSPYALTGALFSEDRYALEVGERALRNAAGNFYINDKPTGAVVGQQPFGGARASGTNDKAGSKQNLYRWVSPRLIKETMLTPEHYGYPFLAKD
ncbi:L-glutamate gamma-semialdehyde dehydrogenase [Croceimicrobium sp.]|uniref:L-glutamate gamma-semialdehyde dehydrogenase n=1 Tax=Croceimicrobium sp. TaxID=2828340 RepID=UPI003BAA2597